MTLACSCASGLGATWTAGLGPRRAHGIRWPHPAPRTRWLEFVTIPLRPMARERAWSDRDDAALVTGCRGGDARAWRELVHRYRRLVHGVPLAMGLQPADADDVFQHTFIELLRSLPRLRDPGRIEAWLVTTSRRAALRVVRDRKRRIRGDRQLVAETAGRAAPSADVAIEKLRERDRVLRALESLGEPCRSLIAGLFADAAESYRSLAARLGLAVGSLGATRARCLEKLRRRLLRAPGVGPASDRRDLSTARGGR